MSESSTLGRLRVYPALNRSELLATPVTEALRKPDAPECGVAEIDPELADTAAFCAAYDVPLEISANCVVVLGKRGGEPRFAACMVLATTRADVNNVIRRHLNLRKASFAPMDTAVEQTDMAYGGITPIGLPSTWPILVDRRVAETDTVVIGSGLRQSKLVLSGAAVATLCGAEVLDGLAITG